MRGFFCNFVNYAQKTTALFVLLAKSASGIACTVATKAFALPRPTELGRQKPSCRHSKNLPSSATGGGRFFSLSHRYAVRDSNLAPPTKKATLLGGFRWRRRRDSNSRTAFDGYTISSRAPSTGLGDFSIFSSFAAFGHVRRLIYDTTSFEKNQEFFEKKCNFI